MSDSRITREPAIHYITANGIGNAWVAQELRILADYGIPFELHSMRAPDQVYFGSEWARRLNEETHLIYSLPASAYLSMFRAPFRYGRRFGAAFWNALTGPRESVRERIASMAHLLVACYWADRLRDCDVRLIHSQWINSCGTIGMYGAWLLGVPFSFTGHAADLFRNRVALEDKVRRADFIVCISSFHRQFYRRHGGQDEQFLIVYCGIDVDRFDFRPKKVLNDPPRILSVGRLVEKKGFDILIEACGVLKGRGERFECIIGGDGPLEIPLRERVVSTGLQDYVTVSGKAVLQEDLAEFLHNGDIFAQPCVWSKDNDVDGTPRTLMEAMACGLPSVSTHLAGIPDIVEHGESGLLVEPGDVVALADALQRLLHDQELVGRLSERGRRKIERDFKLPYCVEPLVEKYREKLGLRKEASSMEQEEAPGVR